MNPQTFVHKWRGASLKERSAAQEHFMDLCQLVGHGTPAEVDPAGHFFTFEKGVSKQRGGQGWADVWYRGHFAWEYKGNHADLDRAYQQLLQYREALENPPLLIVSDLQRIVIHTNFTNTVKQIYDLSLEELTTPAGLDKVRHAFTQPEALRAAQTTAQVTEAAARHFARLAEQLRRWHEDSGQIAHFLIRLLFCLFAEDIGLLPERLFTRLVEQTRRQPAALAGQLRQLFAAMAAGGWFGEHEIQHFNGGLFDDERALALDGDGLDIVAAVSGLDWASIEPSIFGTLFERSLDPGKRAQLGAHYTSKEDILLIVEPVLMAPLRRRWQTVAAEARVLAERRDAAQGGPGTRLHNELKARLTAFAYDISQVRVLDPACGSGNFLYVALRQLLDLEKEVIRLAWDLGVGSFFPSVSPAQVYGLEVEPLARELAQTTVWIGYIQWLHENGFGLPSEPILRPLDNIRLMDAILAYDEAGRPVEPAWPEAEVVIGNPPFLGTKMMRRELGDEYVDKLHQAYDGRVAHESDLVCYWFERARRVLESNQRLRAGLIATNSIRGGANRRVLERIKDSGDIFMAWSDRPWVLDGAAVRVSIIGFDKGIEQERTLDDHPVKQINPDLTSAANLTEAKRLQENLNLAFMGDTKQGPFDIEWEVAKWLLDAKGNPNGRPNSDVLRPWYNGLDVVRRPRNMWIIDFGTDMPKEEAAQYEAPFEYVKRYVKAQRDANERSWYRAEWWLHYAPRPALREAVRPLSRYIATARVAKHRLFAWLDPQILPDSQLIVFARDDDYFFGVLHSKPHELWSLRLGTALEDRPRYTPTTTFETFPFPWPPGQEPPADPRVEAIAAAAHDLVAKRDAWLHPAGASEAELKKQTLTNLYNQRPTWLDLAHRKLDAAVLAAYGWLADWTDEAILAGLLALNGARAGGNDTVTR